MNRIETRVAAGLLAVAIGFAPFACAAADSKTVPPKTKSPAADVPLIARIVVKPSAQQLAKLRAERRVAALETRAGVGTQAASGHGAATGAL